MPCGMTDTSGLTIAPGDPRDAGAAALLRQSHDLMRALFPPEDNFFLDAGEIFGCQPVWQIKVVVESIFRGRSDIKLDIVEYPADSCCHDMRRTMAQYVQIQIRL